ncbi:MAG: SGNH/GDSL hydrolase family protein [Richelia sp. RM2_1_2]|nr:SGNH/GDSL hydrolase family protein [Richelia sp. SM2_1_7]NJN06714.1 SGNH/GDSL hydrolase family protein [Richelia sp. RM1_1_1]NJO58276.1 SGNH/GDSL hydrolase family protein [Richelia sp. RM2_1_2]
MTKGYSIVRFYLLIIVAAIIGLFVVSEMGLRLLFGFGNPLTYIGDEKIGYLLTPSQRTRRFGNRIEINQYSMRGANIQQTPLPSSLRILLLGDSIANGGWWTDQEKTISHLTMLSLTSNLSANITQVEVLNASANSWGPRNELAYLQRFGSFGASSIVLLINTDDLFSTAPTSVPVGRDRNYPDQKPPFALAEVFNRYILKPKPIPELKGIQNENDRVGINLAAIGQIQEFTRANNAQFLLAMTPLLREIGEPGPRDYEIKARQRLLEFTQTQGIIYIDFLPIFNSSQNPKALYHDHIHFNLQGNKLISENLQQKLLGL